MFQTSAFGQVYAGVGGGDVGASIYDAQRENVTFARYVERQKLSIQKRQLDQREAQMEAQRESAQQNYELAQAKFELERQRLDQDYEDRQLQRRQALEAYKEASRIREQQYKDKRSDEAWDRQVQEQAREYKERELDFRRLQERGRQYESQRKEFNDLSKLNARRLEEGASPARGEYSYVAVDGSRWAVPRTVANSTAGPAAGSPNIARRSLTDQRMKQAMSPLEQIKQDNTKVSEADFLDWLVDFTEANSDNAEANRLFSGVVDDVRAGLSDKATHSEVMEALLSGKGMEGSESALETLSSSWDAEKRRRAAISSVLNNYMSQTALNPELVSVLTPAQLAAVKWKEAALEDLDTLNDFIMSGVYDKESVMGILRLLEGGKN